MNLVLESGRKHFVHRYKWSHDKKRKQFLRMFKDGKIDLLKSTREGWLYRIKGGDNDRRNET